MSLIVTLFTVRSLYASARVRTSLVRRALIKEEEEEEEEEPR